MAEQQVHLVPGVVPTNHGNTVAAWALCGLLTVGMIIGAIGFDMANTVVFGAGVAIMVLGLVAGAVLKAAGYGQGGAKTLAKAKAHH